MAEKIDLRELTKQEFLRCSQDYVHAIKNYPKIEHPKRGKIPFNLYPFQEKTLREFQQHRFNIVLKSRQMGISTLVAAYSLFQMIFNPNYKVLVIATNQDVAMNLIHKVKVMIDTLPSWLRPKISENNKLKVTLGNGSTIKASSSNENAGRSEALSLLVIDEAAFIYSFESIWTAAQMTLATGGDAIILSTPNGVDNLFHKLYSEAETGIVPEGLDGFNPINLKWDLHPERDQTWRDNQTALLGAKQAAQECDCDFLTSGHSVIDGEIIKWYEDNHVTDPKEKRWQGETYWIWEYPDITKTYEIIVDVARGDGSDESTIQVIDVVNCVQVAEYAGHMGTRELGRAAVAVATEYNHGLLVIENKNIGWDTVQEAIDLEYKNLYYSLKSTDGYIDPQVHLPKGNDLLNKKDMTPGFTTDTRTRPLVINKLETYFRNKTIIVKSKRLINQLYVFIWLNNKAQAARGRLDDLVMALGIGLYVRDTALKLREMGLELTKTTLEHTHKTVYKPTNDLDQHYQMRVKGQAFSTKWVL